MAVTDIIQQLRRHRLVELIELRLAALDMSMMDLCRAVDGRRDNGQTNSACYAYMRGKAFPSTPERRAQLAKALKVPASDIEAIAEWTPNEQEPVDLPPPSRPETRPAARPAASKRDQLPAVVSTSKPVPPPQFSLVLDHQGIATLTLHVRVPVDVALRALGALSAAGVLVEPLHAMAAAGGATAPPERAPERPAWAPPWQPKP